jgi:hypothetical protein
MPVTRKLPESLPLLEYGTLLMSPDTDDLSRTGCISTLAKTVDKEAHCPIAETIDPSTASCATSQTTDS